MRSTGGRTGLLALLVCTLAGCASAEPEFTAEDEAGVRALEDRFRTAWLADDTAAVLATLSDDAVLMPAGREPIIGHDHIRAFWWPDDGSATTITSYELDTREVHGDGDLAFLRGFGRLAFSYTTPGGQTSDLTSRAAYVSIVRRDADGDWRIARRIWSPMR